VGSRHRERFTYANVTSTLALVIALGGGVAVGAKAIVDSSKDIAPKAIKNSDLRKDTLKSNRLEDGAAVKGADVVANSLGGAAINEADLSQVPSAASAVSATSAASAVDASALGGLDADQFARSSHLEAGGPANSNATTQTPLVSFSDLGLEVRTDGDADVAAQVRIVNSEPPGGRTYLAVYGVDSTDSTLFVPGSNSEIQPGNLVSGGFVRLSSTTPPTVAILLSCSFNGFDAVLAPVTCFAIRSA